MPAGKDSFEITTSRYTRADNDGNAGLGLLCVATYTVLWTCSCLSPVLIFMLAYTRRLVALACVIGCLSLCYIPFAGPVTCVRRFYARWAPTYFKSYSLTFEGEHGPNHSSAKPTLFAFHPHGIFSMGWGLALLQKEFDGTYACVSSTLLASPIFRLFMNLTSGFSSAVDKDSLQRLMSRRVASMALLPGGFEEATLHSSSGPDRAYIKSRFGFIKLALQHGYQVRAVYTLGERHTFHNLQGFWRLRFWLNQLGVPAIVPLGRDFCPLVARPDAEIRTFVSRPLKLPCIPNPSRQDVAKWHAQYVSLLQDLHARHRGQEAELEVW